MGEQVVGQQHADLIAGQHAVTDPVGDRGGEAVGVGIVGEHQRRAGRGRQRQHAIHRAFLLGVGERHRRERPVGLALRRLGRQPIEAGRSQHALHQRRADAVQRRVRDRQVGPRHVRGHLQRQHRGDVGVLELGAHRAQLTGGARGLEVGHRDRPRRRALDGRGDATVDRRDDLRAVAPVHLVAVVLGRVVARGDHHPGRGAVGAHRVRGHRRRPRMIGQPHREPGGEQHRGGLLDEPLRLVPRVAADHHAAALGVGDLRREVRRQARGHVADLQLVHALGAGGQDAADARGTELQPTAHPLGQLGGRGGVGGGALDQYAELGAGVGIRIGGAPLLGARDSRLDHARTIAHVAPTSRASIREVGRVRGHRQIAPSPSNTPICAGTRRTTQRRNASPARTS